MVRQRWSKRSLSRRKGLFIGQRSELKEGEKVTGSGSLKVD